MRQAKEIHLGYEVGGGEAVSVPVGHLVVTGQTQASGKTTTLEALVVRSRRTAVAFRTKRGESAFSVAPHLLSEKFLKPYFRPRADWQFVSDLLGAMLQEKLKFERSWIMSVCKGRKDLREVAEEVDRRLNGQKKLRGLDESVLTTLSEYFKLLLPEMERYDFGMDLRLSEGLNVMDLEGMSLALQMLVIGATVAEIYRAGKGVVTIVPEAWEFAPQGRSSPAKREIEGLMRKGGSLENFVWIDSQDIAGVEKTILRQAKVWLLGVQREANEIKRTLEHVPVGIGKKLKAADLVALERGQFFVCHGNVVRKVYVQPAWLSSELARHIAKGEASVSEYKLDDVVSGDPIAYLDSRGDSRDLDRAVEKALAPGKWEHTCEDCGQTVEVGMYGHMVHHKAHPGGVAICPGSGKQVKLGFPDLPVRIDPDCPPDTIWQGQGFQPAPPGVRYYMGAATTLDEQLRLEAEAVDNHTREVYEAEIRGLKAQLEEATKQIAALRRVLPASGVVTGQPIGHPFRKYDGQPFVDEDAIKELLDRVFADPRMAAAGKVTVEAREVVLDRYCESAVVRALSEAKLLTDWQRSVIQLLEAKQKPMFKAALVTAITGKSSNAMPRDFKQEYQEVDDLAAQGWVKINGKSGVHPNVSQGICKLLDDFEATDEQLNDALARFMLEIKGATR